MSSLIFPGKFPQVGAVVPHRSKVMRSAAKPIMLAFEAPAGYSFFS